MSRNETRQVPEGASLDQWVAAARERIYDMCRGGRWRMSIPARPGFDYDLVISTALSESAKRIAALEAENGELSAHVELLQDENAELHLREAVALAGGDYDDLVKRGRAAIRRAIAQFDAEQQAEALNDDD